MPKILVDGDGILYRCGFAGEKTKYLVEYGEDFVRHDSFKETREYPDTCTVWSRKQLDPIENVLHSARTVIEKLVQRYKGRELEIWLSPSVGNFREQIAKTAKYKGNRDQQQRPTYYKDIQKYLVEYWDAKYTEGQEADDALGIGATNNSGSVIVSHDKDLLQIPGLHYNWTTEEEISVSAKEGSLNFYSQVISGDAVDNVPGIPGLGPVRSRKMLGAAGSVRDCWQIVRDAYKDHGGDDRAIETARLVYVRRKEGEIWEPPT